MIKTNKKTYENVTTEFDEETQTDESKPQISAQKWSIMKKLSWVVCLSFLFMVGEALGGYFTNSLAVMSDAAHLFSDVCGYVLSLVAVYLSTLPKSKSMPFGYVRAEIVGALCSVLMLWVVLFHLVQEGMERISQPAEIKGRLMFIISTCGLGVNLLMGFILAHSGHSHSHGLRKCNHSIGDEDMKTPLSPTGGANNVSFDITKIVLSMNSQCGASGCNGDDCRHLPESPLERKLSCDEANCPGEQNDMQNLNIRAAYIHVLADTMQSFGVVVSSALIWYDPVRFNMMDPICTLIFAALGFACSLGILNDITSIFMIRSPKHIDLDVLRADIQGLDARILDIQDLRVWGLTANEHVLTCRICTRSDSLNSPSFFDKVKNIAKQHGILDATIQVENIAPKQKKRRYGNFDFSVGNRSFV